MTRDTQHTVRNSANGSACVACATAGTPSDNGMGVNVAHNTRRSGKRHTAVVPPSTADVPAGSDIITMSADVPADTLINTVPADVPADTLINTVPADVPADVPAVPTFADTFRALFPSAATVPAWIDTACRTIRVAWDSVPADVRPSESAESYRRWIDAFHAADPEPAPPMAHRYTFGSGSDIARTQNALYVACAVAGIPRKRIPNTFGVALWRFVLGGPFDPTDTGIGGYRGRTRCDYAAHADYWASTLGRMIAHDHNDTPGIVNVDAENVVRVWASATPEPEPEPES